MCTIVSDKLDKIKMTTTNNEGSHYNNSQFKPAGVKPISVGVEDWVVGDSGWGRCDPKRTLEIIRIIYGKTVKQAICSELESVTLANG